MAGSSAEGAALGIAACILGANPGLRVCQLGGRVHSQGRVVVSVRKSLVKSLSGLGPSEDLQSTAEYLPNVTPVFLGLKHFSVSWLASDKASILPLFCLTCPWVPMWNLKFSGPFFGKADLVLWFRNDRAGTDHTTLRKLSWAVSSGLCPLSFQGFSVEGQENLQEILSKQLLLCQFLMALSVVRTGDVPQLSPHQGPTEALLVVDKSTDRDWLRKKEK